MGSKPGKLIVGGFGAETKLKSDGRCPHDSFVVDGDARTVECGRCGKVLDPLDILVQYAQQERRFRHYDTMAREKHRELLDLEAEEKRVKARTRNASRKDADAAVAAERKQQAQRLDRARYRIVRAIENAKAALRHMPADGVVKRRLPARQERVDGTTYFHSDERPRCDLCNELLADTDGPPERSRDA